MKTNLKHNFLFIWIILLIVNILVRLPHFLSKNFFIDEDEAIIGLMGQDILSGEGISYYFYGQNYGLSIFESLSVAGSIQFLGDTIWALKIGSLLLFTLGLTFLYKAISKSSSSLVFSFLLIMLLSIFPTWYLWGAMPRGGYVTAFATASAIYYLSLKQNDRSWVTPLLALLTYITYDAHSFLLLPILPFLFIWWWRKEHKIKPAILFSAIVLGLIFAAQYFLVTENASQRLPLELSNISWENLVLHFGYWDHAFSGFFYFAWNLDPPKYWLIGIFALAILFLVSIIYLCVKGYKNHKPFLFVSGLTLAFGVLILSTIDIRAPRYMIGIYTLFIFLFIFLVTHVKTKLNLFIVMGLTAISVIGVTAGSKIPRHWFEEDNFNHSLEKAHDYAKENNIKAVFALDHQFTWNYLYGKEIPATNLCWSNRTVKFSERVKHLFYSDSSSVMLIGMPNYSYGVDKTDGFAEDTTGISRGIFILRNVGEAHLENGRKNYPCYETDESRKIPEFK